MKPAELALRYAQHINGPDAESPPPCERVGTLRTLEAHGFTAEVAVLHSATGLVGIRWRPALPPAAMLEANQAAILYELDVVVMGPLLAPSTETAQ